MIKACLFGILLSLGLLFPAQAFDWETTRSEGREYVTLQSFAQFYNFAYQRPSETDLFRSSNGAHTLQLKPNSAEAFIDGVHYVLSFPVTVGQGDLLVSQMDVVKLFDPILRPLKIPGRHSIRGIVLDAGHGGTDNGAVSPYTHGMEKVYTRDTVFRIQDLLRDKYDLKVVLTRRTDVFVDLYERARIASFYPDYAFVSIHFNCASPDARGLETYCLSPSGAASTSSNYISRSDAMKQPGNVTDPFNILLASCVHSEIIKLNPGDGTADRGVKRARFAVLRVNSLPSILVEGGFVSNRMESASLNTEKYRQRLAEAVALGIAKFVALMDGHPLKIQPETTPDEVTPAPATPTHLAKALDKTNPAKPVVPPATVATTPVKKEKTPPSVASSDKSSKTKKPGLAANDKSTEAPSAPAITPISPAANPPDVDKATPTEVLMPPAPTTNTVTDTDTNAAPLNLAEPAPVPPTPGSEKAPPEPDEPPVTIYNTATNSAPSTGTSAAETSAPVETNAAPAPPSETSAPAPETNAAPNPPAASAPAPNSAPVPETNAPTSTPKEP